jgi:hypothetical protein
VKLPVKGYLFVPYDFSNYSLSPKLLECFGWNTNIKESIRNLQKCPIAN